MITLSGSEDLRERLVLATLAGKPIKITGIRSDDVNPGLTDYEVSFLRLLESITNGSVLEISYTGTTLIYKPGLIIGGSISHNCPNSKGIAWFIEPVLLLAPFAKKQTVLTLRGVTSASDDVVSVDAIRTTFFPVLAKFGIERSELRIVKRGSAPGGGGEIVLTMPHQVLHPKTIHALSQIQVNKIRGVAYSPRVSPASVNRVVESARQLLKPTQVDTFIYTDVTRGAESGASPGFGVTLVAETRSGWPVCAQAIGSPGAVPEEVGALAARRLLEQLSLRGAVSKCTLPFVLIMMTLGSEDVGRLLVGRDQFDESVVRLLRDVNHFWGGTKAIVREDDKNSENNIVLALTGTGFVSASRKIA